MSIYHRSVNNYNRGSSKTEIIEENINESFTRLEFRRQPQKK